MLFLLVIYASPDAFQGFKNLRDFSSWDLDEALYVRKEFSSLLLFVAEIRLRLRASVVFQKWTPLFE